MTRELENGLLSASDRILENVKCLGSLLRVTALDNAVTVDVMIDSQHAIPSAYARFAIALDARWTELSTKYPHADPAMIKHFLRQEGWLQTAADHALDQMGA